jgi:L-ribulokinase
MRRGICAAGHKGMFNSGWGGYPDVEFLARLDPRLVDIRASLPDKTYPIGEKAGELSPDWASRTGLIAGISVSIGAIDAHAGAVGAGITPGALVKIMGTSTCDIMIAPLSRLLPDIAGLCGIVPESVLPGYYGLEAGQSAVGDIFNWFVTIIRPGNFSHAELTSQAAYLRPGESGLLALDWHNGNRTVLVDQRLTGAILGLTLQTTPAEIYRSWIEATAFGARAIVERLEESGQLVERIIITGGIATNNALAMEIYANVLGRPVLVAGSAQTCALGSAIAAAVAAGCYDGFADATAAMTKIESKVFEPEQDAAATYERLYGLYLQIHDAFGVRNADGDLFNVMKDLLAIRDSIRAALG